MGDQRCLPAKNVRYGGRPSPSIDSDSSQGEQRVIADKKDRLSSAKTARRDEFYTQLTDIERELKHYREHFKDKVVYCNCDDPRVSNFFTYFSYNFERLGLKKLITTCYKSQQVDLFSQNDSEQAISLEYSGMKDPDGRVPDPEDIGIRLLEGDGDFRSRESVELLEEADIVVTNPPFSLFREYMAQLVAHDKKFLIIAHQNAITYKEIFPLFKDNRLWLGYGFPGGATHFYSEYEDTATATDRREGMIRVSGVHWFTNLEHNKRHEDLILYKTFDPDEYPTYDNYEAIEVAKTKEIPMNYDGIMGVPITFLDKYNPDQFEIVGIAKAPLGTPSKTYPRQVQVNSKGVRSAVTKLNDGPALKVDKAPVGKTWYEVDGDKFVQVYARILIRQKG